METDAFQIILCNVDISQRSYAIIHKGMTGYSIDAPEEICMNKVVFRTYTIWKKIHIEELKPLKMR